jgi:hypothetical protein
MQNERVWHILDAECRKASTAINDNQLNSCSATQADLNRPTRGGVTIFGFFEIAIVTLPMPLLGTNYPQVVAR